MTRTVHLTFVSPGYYSRPDIDADVVRETANQIVLKHPALGAEPVKFSRSNGFPVGNTRERAIGRVGYCLPIEEMKRRR